MRTLADATSAHNQWRSSAPTTLAHATSGELASWETVNMDICKLFSAVPLMLASQGQGTHSRPSYVGWLRCRGISARARRFLSFHFSESGAPDPNLGPCMMRHVLGMPSPALVRRSRDARDKLRADD